MADCSTSVAELTSCFLKKLRSYDGDGAMYLEVIIPTYNNLADAERLAVDDGGEWPVRFNLVELPREQCLFIEFLVERRLATWPQP